MVVVVASRPRTRAGWPFTLWLTVLVGYAAVSPHNAFAQPGDEGAADNTPAFSLSSSETFTTRDAPYLNITYRRLTALDFRVYKVRDAAAFFAGLRDPHQLGSEETPVAQELSWIERIAQWKSTRRSRIRSFVRAQVSAEYRGQRRAARDQAVVSQRVALNATSFAQVPLLNPDQLVTSWRELLPDHRDAEYRRIPLEVTTPGVYLVEAVSGVLRAYTIVLVSDVGLVSKTAPGQMLLFAADRHSGEPQPGCDVQVLVDRAAVARGTTGSDGVLTVALPETQADDLVTVARCGDAVAVTDPGGWSMSEPSRQLVAYTYTDKPIYRPGHTVHVKSVLRWRAQDALAPFDATSAELAVRDTQDKVIVRRSLTPDTFGAIHASFPLPDGAALGSYTVRIASGEHESTSGFEVQEYRRPEYEVIVSPTSRFVVQGGEAVLALQARYYFGQPVVSGRVRYVVNQQPYYSPLRWTDSGGEDEGAQYWYGDDQTVTGELRLDNQGRGEIRVPLARDDEGRDYSARIEAQVTDASSRVVSGTTVVHATHAAFLLTVDTSGYVYRAGQSVSARVRAVDYLGTAQAGRRVRLLLERVTYPGGPYGDPQAVQVGEASTTTGADGAGAATLRLPAESGSYRVRAVTDEGEVTVSADTSLWVAGPQEADVADGNRYLELIADKRTYAPGDTARLVVRGETVAGPVLITKEGQQVTWHEVRRTVAGEAIDVPLTTADIGDTYVHVAWMRDGRLYRAERRLSVPPADRALTIQLTPDSATAKPQQPGIFSVSVTDAAGAPVSAQVSLGVIDEAVYAVRTDDTPDPLRFFYRREYSRVGTAFSRDYYFTGYSGSERLQLATRRRRPFTLADFKGDKPIQPQVRKEFPDAIYWLSDLVTDASGQAKVSLKYPDALTTWRLTARAVTRDTRAGAAVTRTTTTKDLIVRVITPRFLTEGDEVVLPTIAHNYLPEAKPTTVSVATAGIDAATGAPTPASVEGAIASGGERRDDWRFAAPRVGTAIVTATARTDVDVDAVELPIPVQPYGLAREAGQSGSLLSEGEQASELTIPADSNASGRTITVSLAPSLAGSLLGALDYLTSYPYGCTEQILSGFLPNVLVTRALAQLKLAPTERLQLLDRQTRSGLQRLADNQHDDGGWGWWKADENHPFMTAYALYGMSEAKRAGYAVDEERISDGVRALTQLYAKYPNAVPELKAYLAFVLGRVAPGQDTLGDYRAAAVRDELWNARVRMSAYGRALLLLVLDEAKDGRSNELAQALLGDVQSRGELSWWASDRDPLLGESVDTSVEATALAVQALVRRDPTNPVIDRAVRWLMLNRRGGYWWNTKQTAFALYGLLEVMQVRRESATPFAVDVYVNGNAVGTRTFDAAALTAPEPLTVVAPAQAGNNNVRLVKRGGGSLYWSTRATWFDPNAAVARRGSRELAITRSYSRLVPVTQKDRIVYQEQPVGGPVTAGEVLAVRLTVAGSNDWRYLMVEDPLPAGVEAVQDTTAYPMERADRWRWWWGSQTEYRDNRTVFFQQEFDGRSEFIYLVRAVSAGNFRAAPAQVMPMYVPEVAASSDPARLSVTVTTGAPQQ